MVIGPTEPDPIVRFTRECQEMGVPYIYSPIWQIIRMSARTSPRAQGAKVVVANDYEYELIKDKTGMDQQHILQFAEMVTTRGKHGSLIMTQDEVAVIPPATPREVVDPVGAGDAYLGGLVYGLNAGMDIHRAGRVAALAAVYAIEHTARSPMPTRARVRPAVRRDIRRRASHQRGHVRRQIRSHA